jgi:hypothetical protein
VQTNLPSVFIVDDEQIIAETVGPHLSLCAKGTLLNKARAFTDLYGKTQPLNLSIVTLLTRLC